MRIEPNIAQVGALFGEPSRAAMLTVLLDGRALPAGELAAAAGVGLTAASGHLAKLVAGRLLTMRKAGRHRYYQLAGPEVAAVIEDLGQLAPLPVILQLPKIPPAVRALRLARSCYDHLAGELAVAVAAALEERRYLRRSGDRRYEIGGERARRWFAGQGIDLRSLRPTRHGLGRQCLDWTERQPHLAGPLGAALFAAWRVAGWLRRHPVRPRLVEVTDLGRTKLRQHLGIIVPVGDAQWRPRQFNAKPLRDVAEWVEHNRQFWDESSDRLEVHLQEIQKPAKKPERRKK